MGLVDIPKEPIACENLVGGEHRAPKGERLDVISPYTGGVVGTVPMSSADDVDAAVKAADRAAAEWREVPLTWVRRQRTGRIVGIVFDPLLDPRDFTLVEHFNRHITSVHYLNLD